MAQPHLRHRRTRLPWQPEPTRGRLAGLEQPQRRRPPGDRRLLRQAQAAAVLQPRFRLFRLGARPGSGGSRGWSGRWRLPRPRCWGYGHGGGEVLKAPGALQEGATAGTIADVDGDGVEDALVVAAGSGEVWAVRATRGSMATPRNLVLRSSLPGPAPSPSTTRSASQVWWSSAPACP